MKSAGKLIFKCICVMLPMISVCLYMRLNPLAYIDGEAPYYIWNREKTNITQEQDYDVIILGDSAANAAYVPELLSGKTLNLSLGGTTPMESYYILKDWLGHNRAPKACYISFMDGHLQGEDCFWSRTIYAHRFALSQNVEMLNNAEEYGESTILNEKYVQAFISYELYLPHKYITALMNASINQRYAGNMAAWQTINLHEGRYIGKMVAEYTAEDAITYDSFFANPLFDDYYRKLISLCEENRIAVHLVKVPLPSNSCFTDNYKNTFRLYYENLEKEHPDITVDWIPLYDIDCFWDPKHMNSHGALKFSMELKALYPMDFDSEMSLRQAEGIDDYIRDENSIEQILKWTEGKDYTVVFCDKNGTFEKIYEEQYEDQTGQLLQQLDAENTGDGISLYSISGIGQEDIDFQIDPLEDGFIIQLEEQGAQCWETMADDALGVAVVDNYNNCIVCTKTFRYCDDVYELVA